MSPFAGDPGRAEQFGHRGIAKPQKKRTLQHHGHLFDQAPSARFEVILILERLLEEIGRTVLSCVHSARQLDLGEERGYRLWLTLHGPQHVERVDVAGTFPDRIERRLAVEEGAGTHSLQLSLNRATNGTPSSRA